MALVDFSYPLDEKLCGRVHPLCYHYLRRVANVLRVFDADAFSEANGRDADVASCFLEGEEPCGSVKYRLMYVGVYYSISTINGTLCSLRNDSIRSDIPIQTWSAEYIRLLRIKQSIENAVNE